MLFRSKSKLPTKIRRVSSPSVINILFFKYSQLGASELGNFRIENTSVNGDPLGTVFVGVPYTKRADLDGVTDDNPMLGKNFVISNIYVGTEVVTVPTQPSASQTLGARMGLVSSGINALGSVANNNVFINGESFFVGNSNINSTDYANNITVDTSEKVSGVLLNTGNDYRVISISLAPKPINSATHEGLILQGVKMLIPDNPTQYAKQYQTQDPNASITIKNHPTGFTEVINMRGVWVAKNIVDI